MLKGKVTVLETNIMYLLGALLLVTVGGYVQTVNVKIGLIITEYVLVLLPVIILLKIKNINLKAFLRINKLRVKHGLIIIVSTILLYPVAAFSNSIMIMILNIFGLEIKPVPIPPANNLTEYVGLFFIVAISAGICEEIFFRGLILKVYQERYKKAGIIMSAVLFGIFHFNLQNLFGPIVLGLFFGYLVYLTDSIYAGIIGHITNNGVAVTLMYGLNIFQKKFEEYGDVASDTTISNNMQLIVGIVMIGFFAAITGLLAYYLVRIIKNDMNKNFTASMNVDPNLMIVKKEEKFRMVKHIPILIVVIIYGIFAFLMFS